MKSPVCSLLVVLSIVSLAGCAADVEADASASSTPSALGWGPNWTLPPFKATAETFKVTAPGSSLTSDRVPFLLQHPCATATWTVPAGVNLVRIEAVGGSGAGTGGAGLGGRGAKVSGVFLVTPGETLSIMAATNGTPTSHFGVGFPGGGLGYMAGGGASYVARGAVTRNPDDYARDPNTYTFSCSVDPSTLMVVAGGGGADGLGGGFFSGGAGGDAGLLNDYGQPGVGGNGSSAGGGGGGATLSRGGTVGSHSGCRSDVRWEGRFLRGGETEGNGGAGGAGYYGGGAGGGDGACSPFLIGGSGGGGGGSSAILGVAVHPASVIDTARTPYVSITPGVLSE